MENKFQVPVLKPYRSWTYYWIEYWMDGTQTRTKAVLGSVIDGLSIAAVLAAGILLLLSYSH